MTEHERERERETNDRVSIKNKVLKTYKNNNFSLDSVNGGHSFLSKTNYDFF